MENNKKNTLPPWIKWLAKDDDGELWGYEDKPINIGGKWYRQSNEDSIWLTILSSRYPTVKSTDTEPTLVSDIFREDGNV